MTSTARLFALLCALLCGGAAGPALGAANDDGAADSIEEMLQQRWFEIELIVFERLDMLDVNSSEVLTLTRPRAWPSNLLEFGSFLPQAGAQAVDAAAAPASSNPLTAPTPYCLGYPELTYEDPLHPALLRPDEQPDLLADEDPADEDPADEGPAAADPAATEAADETPAGDAAVDTAASPATPWQQLRAEVAAFEQDLYASSYRWLTDLSLQSEVKAINRQRHLRPIMHGRWRQPVPERGEPQPIYVASASGPDNPPTQAGMARLEGHIAVTVGRYLHFAPTLWYHADNLGLTPIALPAPERLPQPDYRLHMQLDESRRLRSGDLHYLDHPKFGVLVRIDPVAVPEALLNAFVALTERPDDRL